MTTAAVLTPQITVDHVTLGCQSGAAGLVTGVAHLTGQARMIKNSVGKGARSRMTEIAFLGRHHMVRRLDHRSNRVSCCMAGGTGSDYPSMFHRRPGKGRRARVAGGAVLASQITMNHITFRRQPRTTRFMAGGAELTR
jgi:hypothetical protein